MLRTAETETLLDRHDLARKLNVAYQTAGKMLRDNRLPGFKLPGSTRWLIRASDVDRLVNSLAADAKRAASTVDRDGTRRDASHR